MATANKPASAVKKVSAKKGPAKKLVASNAPAVKKTATAKKSGAVKVASEKAAPAAKKRTPNAAFMRAMTPSDELAAIIGATPVPRTEVTKKLWEYIKKNNLQDSVKRTMINADAKLKAVVGVSQISMFGMTKEISKHLK